MLVDARENKLTGQGLAGFQRPDGLVMMFARVLILLLYVVVLKFGG